MKVYNDELYHYGKKGMRWRHRKSGSTDYNSIDRYHITRDGKRISKSVRINNYKEDAPIKYTDKDKIKVGMALVALVIAANRNK